MTNKPTDPIAREENYLTRGAAELSDEVDRLRAAKVTQEPDDDALIEQIARLVAPASWEVMDGHLDRLLHKYRSDTNVMYDRDAFKHKESMATARQILALTRLQAKAPETGEKP